jgi:hypothetical protein
MFDFNPYMEQVVRNEVPVPGSFGAATLSALSMRQRQNQRDFNKFTSADHRPEFK